MVDKEIVTKQETYKSGKFGTNYNKEQFNDYEFISEMPEVRVKEVRLYDNGSYLAGIEVYYETANQIVTPGVHCTVHISDIENPKDWIDYKKSSITEKKLILDEDEFINYIEIRSGSIVDSILLKTNKLKSISAGGTGGDLSVLKFKKGEQLIAFSGSHPTAENRDESWATIHHLHIHFGRIPPDIMLANKIDCLEERKPKERGYGSDGSYTISDSEDSLSKESFSDDSRSLSVRSGSPRLVDKKPPTTKAANKKARNRPNVRRTSEQYNETSEESDCYS